MILLLKDLFRRRWWLFLIAVLLPFLGMLEGRTLYGVLLAFVVFYGPIMLFMFEASVNSVRSCVTLPLSRRTLGRTIWVACMALFPVLMTPAWLAGEFLILDIAIGIPLLASGCLLCLGCIGWVLMMTVLLGDRSRLTGFRGLVWGLVSIAVCAPGVLGMIFFLHRFAMALGMAEGLAGGERDSGPLWLAYVAMHRIAGPAERFLNGPNVAVLAVSLFLVLLSFGIVSRFAFPGLGLSGMPKSQSAAAASSHVSFSPRSRALLWPWLGVTARFLYGVALLVFSISMSLAVFQLLTDLEVELSESIHEVPWQALFVAVLFPALLGLTFPWLNSLRSLRALPLSRLKLTLLLVSFPGLAMVLSLSCLAAPLLMFQSTDGFSHLLDWALLVFGLTLFGCGLCLRCGPIPAAVFLLGSMFAGVTLEMALAQDVFPVAYFHAGTALVFPPMAALGLYWLYRLIASSSAAYQRRVVNEGPGLRVA